MTEQIKKNRKKLDKKIESYLPNFYNCLREAINSNGMREVGLICEVTPSTLCRILQGKNFDIISYIKINETIKKGRFL